MLLSNYADAFTTAKLGVLFKNTMLVGIVSTILSLIITVLTAFAFARLEFKGKELLFAALLATMMIPGELFTITNYSTVTNLGWRNTYTVLIVPFLVSVFYIYLLRQSFLQIPNELYLAAKVDGTSDFKYLWKVMVPLSLPTLIPPATSTTRCRWPPWPWSRRRFSWCSSSCANTSCPASAAAASRADAFFGRSPPRRGPENGSWAARPVTYQFNKGRIEKDEKASFRAPAPVHAAQRDSLRRRRGGHL